MLLSLCGRFPECFFFLYLRMERIFSHSQQSPWFFFGSFYIWFDFLSPFNRCVVYVYLFVYWNSSVRLFYFFCLICSAFSVTRCIFGYTHNAFAVDLGEWKPSGQKKQVRKRKRWIDTHKKRWNDVQTLIQDTYCQAQRREKNRLGVFDASETDQWADKQQWLIY